MAMDAGAFGGWDAANQQAEDVDDFDMELILELRAAMLQKNRESWLLDGSDDGASSDVESVTTEVLNNRMSWLEPERRRDSRASWLLQEGNRESGLAFLQDMQRVIAEVEEDPRTKRMSVVEKEAIYRSAWQVAAKTNDIYSTGLKKEPFKKAVIRVFRDGDREHIGVDITVVQAIFRTLPEGVEVRRMMVYAKDFPSTVHELEDLVDKGEYFASAGGSFLGTGGRKDRRSRGGLLPQFEDMQVIPKAKEEEPAPKPKRKKNKVLTVYRESGQGKGLRFVVNQKTISNLDQLLTRMSAVLRLEGGPVRCLTVAGTGDAVYTLGDVMDGGEYVASSSDVVQASPRRRKE